MLGAERPAYHQNTHIRGGVTPPKLGGRWTTGRRGDSVAVLFGVRKVASVRSRLARPPRVAEGFEKRRP